jgi:hypothetical protein
MKTYSEACLSTFVRPLPDGKRETRLQAVVKIAADAGRWREIEEEMRLSPYTKAFVDSVALLAQAGCMSLREALQSAFMQGAIVGMEMERNDDQMPRL